MPGNMYPTQNAEALRSFVRAQQSLNRYWSTQSDVDLEAATEQFISAERSDPGFALASFYAAVTENEARKHESAIERLKRIADRPVAFRPEAYLHLAYAQAKRYTDEGYREAERALDNAERIARELGRPELLPSINAYRVFVFALICGRSKREDRTSYLTKAVELGTSLLSKLEATQESNAAVMEIHNGLGIAYMRQGQNADQAEERARLWHKAALEFDAVLRLNPNVVRAVQNLGTLRLMEGDVVAGIDTSVAAARYREALDLYRRTVQLKPINSHTTG
jgi:tetratricopeptide (TPR) repeat protein